MTPEERRFNNIARFIAVHQFFRNTIDDQLLDTFKSLNKGMLKEALRICQIQMAKVQHDEWVKMYHKDSDGLDGQEATDLQDEFTRVLTQFFKKLFDLPFGEFADRIAEFEKQLDAENLQKAVEELN